MWNVGESSLVWCFCSVVSFSMKYIQFPDGGGIIPATNQCVKTMKETKWRYFQKWNLENLIFSMRQKLKGRNSRKKSHKSEMQSTFHLVSSFHCGIFFFFNWETYMLGCLKRLNSYTLFCFFLGLGFPSPVSICYRIISCYQHSCFWVFLPPA